MSAPYQKPTPAEQVEEWLGCKRGTLSQTFSVPTRREISQFHHVVETNNLHMRVMKAIAAWGFVVSVPSTLAGAFINGTATGRDFAGPDLSLMSGIFVMPVLGGLMLTCGAQYVRKYLEEDTRREMEEFRAKLPEHVFK